MEIADALDTLRRATAGERETLAAVDTLAAAEYAPAVPALLDRLAHTPSDLLRRAILEALGRIASDEALAALTAALETEADAAWHEVIEQALTTARARRQKDAPPPDRKSAEPGDLDRLSLATAPSPVIRAQSFVPPLPAVQLPPLARKAELDLLEGIDDGDETIVLQPEPTVEPVRFANYYPREVAPRAWYTLAAYMFRESAAGQVVRDAEHTLGGQVATVRRVDQDATQDIPAGTLVTATPYLKGFQFNPPSLTLGFYEDWHRFEFKLRAVDAPLNYAANGYLTFTVSGVIVADVPLSVFVAADAPAPTPDEPPPMAVMSHKPYKAIFCSYSRRDTAIVERVERVIRTLGYDFLRDVHSIRSGEDWNDALYRMIEQADIFQLFWSSMAAQSPYVEKEWRHALSLGREARNFIRPVYWQQPMPAAPPELSRIHFAYEPGLATGL